MSEGRQIQDLMRIYFQNFTGEIAPARSQMAGQLSQILKETTYEKLAPLIKQVAIDGQIVTRNTLIQAGRKTIASVPTNTPPKFDIDEFTNPFAVPMPQYIKDMLQKRIFESPEAD